jgi:hypothetical protein
LQTCVFIFTNKFYLIFLTGGFEGEPGCICNVHDCSTGGSQSSGGVDILDYDSFQYILQGRFGYGGDAAGEHGGGE